MNDLGIIDRPDAALTAQAQTSGLSVVSIAKNYDKRSVLSDVSLSVAKGEVVGLLGPNGAGKTTCFYSIMGLVKPDLGRLLLDGYARSVERCDGREWMQKCRSWVEPYQK